FRLGGYVYDTPLLMALRISDVPRGAQPVGQSAAEARIGKADALIGALLVKGADVNALGVNGTPLTATITRESFMSHVKHVNWVKPILDRGADVNAKVEGYGAALFVALGFSHDLEIPKLLIDLGADVNAVNKDGLPLLLAALNGETNAPNIAFAE